MFHAYPTPYGDTLRQIEGTRVIGHLSVDNGAVKATSPCRGRDRALRLERGGARDCSAEHGQRDLVTGPQTAVASQGRPEMEHDLGVRVFGDVQANVVTELGVPSVPGPGDIRDIEGDRVVRAGTGLPHTTQWPGRGWPGSQTPNLSR